MNTEERAARLNPGHHILTVSATIKERTGHGDPCLYVTTLNDEFLAVDCGAWWGPNLFTSSTALSEVEQTFMDCLEGYIMHRWGIQAVLL